MTLRQGWCLLFPYSQYVAPLYHVVVDIFRRPTHLVGVGVSVGVNLKEERTKLINASVLFLSCFWHEAYMVVLDHMCGDKHQRDAVDTFYDQKLNKYIETVHMEHYN